MKIKEEITPSTQAAVNELYGRYCHTFDSGDAAGCGALFTPDATFTAHGGEPIVGRKALEEFFLAAAARSPGMRHHVVNVVLEREAYDEITGCAYVLGLRVAADGVHLATMGTYRDTFTFDGESWLIASRYYTPAIGADLAGALLATPQH
jgi:hypothetical protein